MSDGAECLCLTVLSVCVFVSDGAECLCVCI